MQSYIENSFEMTLTIKKSTKITILWARKRFSVQERRERLDDH
jgi:hypothetical protein